MKWGFLGSADACSVGHEKYYQDCAHYCVVLVLLCTCFLYLLNDGFGTSTQVFVFVIPQFVANYSRMRNKGSRFTLGVWGLRVCSLDVAFVAATVRNRSREGRMAVPMVSSAEVVIFGGFKLLVASFRVAGVALRDIQTCFVTCRSRFVWQAQYFCNVFRRCVLVFVAGAALWTCQASFCVHMADAAL